MSKEVAALIKDAIVLITPKEQRCTGDYAMGRSGRLVHAEGKSAVQWCFLGALWRAAFLRHRGKYGKAVDACLAASQRLYGTHGIDVNDGPDGHRRILRAMRAAYKAELEAA
jgi:hypothetical protein